LGALARKTRSARNLRHAWALIQAKGRHSKSRTTKAEIAAFSDDSDRGLDRIRRALAAGTFRFAPATGVLARKSSGKRRPLVISPIPNRIVQRALLDVIQQIPLIASFLKTGNNFGGIEGSGVPQAAQQAYYASREYGFFIRTDIKNFFVNIPRDKALQKITEASGDDEFNHLLQQATTTELDNLVSLGRHAEMFPLEGKGVAQGCSLSPLLANLLLQEFDTQMNGRGIRCLRYIDDFILFAANRSKAVAALASARRLLSALNLDCYDPGSSDKAECGSCKDGFTFLGCEIRPDRVRPARKNQLALYQKIKAALNQAIYRIKAPPGAPPRGSTYSEAVSEASEIIRGWGNTYFFCTDDNLFASMDQNISDLFAQFDNKYMRAFAESGKAGIRDMLGVFRLTDCRRDEEFRAAVAALPLIKVTATATASVVITCRGAQYQDQVS
jgi:RNA-directed DNA polymerase